MPKIVLLSLIYPMTYDLSVTNNTFILIISKRLEKTYVDAKRFWGAKERFGEGIIQMIKSFVTFLNLLLKYTLSFNQYGNLKRCSLYSTMVLQIVIFFITIWVVIHCFVFEFCIHFGRLSSRNLASFISSLLLCAQIYAYCIKLLS